MRFYIDTDYGDNYEVFETVGHEPTIKSAHKDALKIASSKGYSSKTGYWLVDELGTVLEIVDPWKSKEWQSIV